MWLTIALGIGSSIATEVITWLNKKLGGTVFQGLGAFLFATFVAFVIGIVRVGIDSRFTELDWSTVVSYFTQVFTVSQVWFYLIVQKLSLDVKA